MLVAGESLTLTVEPMDFNIDVTKTWLPRLAVFVILRRSCSSKQRIE
jgi:hypothetical protein